MAARPAGREQNPYGPAPPCASTVIDYTTSRHATGRHPFQLPDLPGGLRPLRDPDATDEE